MQILDYWPMPPFVQSSLVLKHTQRLNDLKLSPKGVKFSVMEESSSYPNLETE